MIMETTEYIRRKKLQEQQEKKKEDKRIDKLVLKKIRQGNKKSTHVWMIEVYTYCTDKKKWLWDIAGDSDGQYRIFGLRSGARYFMRGEFQYVDENRGKKLRVRKYVREE